MSIRLYGLKQVVKTAYRQRIAGHNVSSVTTMPNGAHRMFINGSQIDFDDWNCELPLKMLEANIAGAVA